MTPKPPRKARPRVAVRASVRLRAYDVISDALEHVGAGAVRRVYKHREDSLSEEVIGAINEEVHEQTMLVLDGLIDFDGGES